jgi:NAD-dependent deacetylase
MHGELLSALCRSCGARSRFDGDMIGRPPCPECGQSGGLRPDIVFFGEMPYRMEEIEAAIERADLFVSIGTSGAVYPAAGFVQLARMAGADTLELNLEPSAGTRLFAASEFGPAGALVPAWVDRLLTDR